jgi:hypothetical protein
MINSIINLQIQDKIPRPGKTGIDWYLFCYFLNKFKNKPILEIGVGNGGSLYTITSFSDQVTAIDNWRFNWDKSTVENNLKSINQTVNFIDLDSRDVSIDTQFNFVHLDANKSYIGTIEDLELAKQLCTGIICVDDYMNSVWPEVTWAVDDFVEKNSNWGKIIIGNHQVFLTNIKIDIKELVLEFPLVNRMDTFYLTYGTLPSKVDKFVGNANMQYTWHNLVWGNDKDRL